METFIKDPDSTLDYKFDWTTWLNGDTIASYTVTVSGVTLDSDTNDTTSVTAWASGGTLGSVATIVCQVTTTAGRVDDRTIKLRIQDK